jgi:hypothetical protein
MSGNRANAAAIQRRTMGAQNNVAPPGSSRPVQGQQQMRQSQPRQQPQPRQQMQPQMQPQMQQQMQQQMQPQMQQQPQQPVKMSVSDAIGLITLRLGRIETFIQKMPPLDQIGMNSSGEMGEIGENMRVVDEAVFTNIVARLEKLEQTTKSSSSNESVSTNASNETIDALKHSVEILNAEMDQVKTLLMSLQSFTMQTNQKLTELIFNEQQREQGHEQDDEFVCAEEEDDEELESSENVTQNEDSEILTGNIDLKAFVQSAM